MKKLILLSSILFSLGAKAQVYDTTSLKPYAVVKLETPFYPNWQDTAKARYLHVTINGDNLKDAATFHWVLFSFLGKPLAMGDEKCSGEAYKLWEGNNIFPFVYVAQKLTLKIK